MHTFLTRFAHVVTGVLCGFDRLFFSGTLRRLSYRQGLDGYLFFNRIRYKDFGDHCQKSIRTRTCLIGSLGIALFLRGLMTRSEPHNDGQGR